MRCYGCHPYAGVMFGRRSFVFGFLVTARRRHLGVRQQEGDVVMLDIVFVVLTLLFFIVAAAYVSGCERIK